MISQRDPTLRWQSVFEQIDATMHADPEGALSLCKQVFVETYLWEPPIYVRAAERYGKIMDHLGKSVEARDSLFAAQQAAQGSCLPIYEAKILERLARSYYTAGDYARALQYWNSCAEVSDRTEGDAETWILAKVGLAQVNKGSGNYAVSQALLAEAQARSVEVGNPHLDAKIKINLAVILLEQGQAEAASSVLHETFRICSENLLYDYLAESNLYLGRIAMSEGALDRALAYLEAGMQVAERVNFRWAQAHILTAQAEVYARHADFDKALQAVRQAQAIATADEFSDMLIQQHFAAAEYAAEMNDFATAYAEHKAGRACEQRAAAERPKNDFSEGALR